MSNIHKLIEHLVNNWQNNLSEALAPRVKQQLMDKFKLDADDRNIKISDKNLSDYIDYFDTRLKDNPKITEKDIFAYVSGGPLSVKDFIKLVSPYAGSSKEEGDDEETENIPDVPYNENGIIIYNGYNEENCLKFGKGEQWCITKGSFSNYRYDSNRKNPTFYLVKDTNLPDSNKKSFFVIVVGSDNTYKASDRSNNDVGGRASEWNRWEPWSFVEQNFPSLQGLQRIFKYIPISRTELSINQYKKTSISIDEWEIAPPDFKERYLIARKGKTLFSDITNGEFIKISLPDSQDIATVIAKNYGMIDIDTLLKEFNSFSTQNQKSIIANTRRFTTIGTSIIPSRSYPFSAKKAVVKGELLNIDDDERYYVSNDDKSIIKLKFNDDDVIMDVFTERGTSSLNIKVNERTSAILRTLPKFDDIPFEVLLKLTKDNFISKNIVGDVIEKSKQEDSKSPIIAVNTDEGEIILDTNVLKAYKSEDGEFKLIPFEDDSIQNILRSEKISNSIQDKLIEIISGPYDLPSNISISTIVLILRQTPIEKRIKNGFVIIPSSTQSIINLWLAENPLIVLSPKFTYRNTSPNTGRVDTEAYSDYFNYLRSQNLAYNSEELISTAARNGREALPANPPLTADNIYKPAQYEGVWYLINVNDPASSKKISPSTENIVNANLNAQKVAIILGTAPPPQTRTPRTRQAAEPTAAGAAAPAAGAAAGGIAQIIEAANLTTGFNTLPAAYKNRIIGGEIIQTDRGASKRNEALGNRGRVTQIVSAGQSRFYIIRLSGATPTYIGQASFQPEATHYIITSTRSFNMGRVGNFLASLQQNRIVTEADRLAASLALGAASDEELNELKNKIKPKQDMKLTELKKMIQAEITNILSEAPQTAPTKPAPGVEIAEPGTETSPKTKPRRTVTPEVPEEEPARAMAKKIAARFKKGK